MVIRVLEINYQGNPSFVYQFLVYNLGEKRGESAMALSRGQRLRRLREQRGEEIKQAAPAMGISRGYLSLLERDLKGSRLDHVRATLERAAAYYGVLPEYLLVETPQEYIAVFVAKCPESGVPGTFGTRLQLILEELRRMWGEEEFGLAQTALSLGTTADVITDYLADKVQVTDTVAEQLSSLTGAPINWLVPAQATASDPTAPFQRAIKLAVESGMQPSELETLIQVWLAAQHVKKPSG